MSEDHSVSIVLATVGSRYALEALFADGLVGVRSWNARSARDWQFNWLFEHHVEELGGVVGDERAKPCLEHVLVNPYDALGYSCASRVFVLVWRMRTIT